MKTDQPPVVQGAQPVRVDAIKVHAPTIVGNLEGNPADREVFVVLPPSYDREPNRRYPVVYALHGYFIGAREWMGEIHMPQTAEGAFAKGVPEMILVLPDSKTKHLGSLYASGPTVGDFESFIAGDLIAHIDSHYRTIAKPESRGLVGHSMGGYGATRIGIKHAEKFGALYVMSPGGLRPSGFGGTPDAATMAMMESIRTEEDYARLQGIQRGQFAVSAAYSPNPAKPPFYLDLPFQDGKVRPDIMAKWNANAPIAFLDQYFGKVRRYRAIAIEIGDKDGPGTDPRALHEALNAWGIENSFTVYDGDHTNRLGFRMQDHVLPFFGQHLSFEVGE
jgi:enterochelin esterase-like enzyme